MDWKTTIYELIGAGWTLQRIADECGFASAGALHNLLTGRQKTCDYERGMRLVALHRTVVVPKRASKAAV